MGFHKIWVFPKREKKLPTVLSMSEVKRLLASVANLKHRVILTLVYSSGLRIGEVVKLKRSDVDPGRQTLHIRQSKGRKDRYTVLSTAAYRLLDTYAEVFEQGNEVNDEIIFAVQYSDNLATNGDGSDGDRA